jgi:hypothetical protein
VDACRYGSAGCNPAQHWPHWYTPMHAVWGVHPTATASAWASPVSEWGKCLSLPRLAHVMSKPIQLTHLRVHVGWQGQVEQAPRGAGGLVLPLHQVVAQRLVALGARLVLQQEGGIAGGRRGVIGDLGSCLQEYGVLTGTWWQPAPTSCNCCDGCCVHWGMGHATQRHVQGGATCAAAAASCMLLCGAPTHLALYIGAVGQELGHCCRLPMQVGAQPVPQLLCRHGGAGVPNDLHAARQEPAAAAGSGSLRKRGMMHA